MTKKEKQTLRIAARKIVSGKQDFSCLALEFSEPNYYIWKEPILVMRYVRFLKGTRKQLTCHEFGNPYSFEGRLARSLALLLFAEVGDLE